MPPAMRRLLTGLALLFTASSVKATCHAVGPTATGTGSGVDYNNRMALPAPTAWVRGDTYYLIAGTYGAISTQTPNSGTTVITIKRAWAGDNGSTCSPSIAAGWNDATMGQPAGPAKFPSSYNTTRYWVFDGGYRPAGNWTTTGATALGYGFFIDNSQPGACNTTSCWPFSVSNSEDGSFITIKNMEIKGHGPAGIAVNCPNDPSNRVDDFFRAVYNGTDLTFQYLYLHDSSSTFFKLRGQNNVTVDHVWMQRNSANAGCHAEALSLGATATGLTISNSVFQDTEGTGAVVWLTAGGGGELSSNINIYGNLFYITAGASGHGWGNGILSCINGNGISGLNFFNNTIGNIQSSLSTGLQFGNDSSNCGLGVTAVVSRNNLWYNNVPAGISSTVTNSNNTYLNTTMTGDSGSSLINIPSGAPTPFVSASPTVPANFFLTSNTNVTPWFNTNAIVPGNATDMVGTTRAASRGAFEKAGTGTTPPAAPTGLTSSVSGSTVNLSWTASSGSPIPTAYTLYRGTVHGGPYSIIKSGMTSTSTTDTPANGTYFYVVTAYVGGIVSSITANGVQGTVTCTAACTFPSGTVFVVGGNTQASFNNTFTSTGQPTGSTFTFSTSINATGTGGGVWTTSSESVKSNEVQSTVPAALTSSLVPTSRVFANTNVGSNSPTQTFTFTNTSGPGGTITISSISYVGGNSGDFSQTNNCPSLLMSGLNCTITGTFSPTAAGSRSSNLTIITNDTGSPHSSAVSGTGVTGTPIISLSPSPVNFGDQLLSTPSAPRTVTLSNALGGNPGLDSYGGRLDISCTTTGWFHTQKIGNRWWLCTPLGHVFQTMQVTQVVPNSDSTYQTKVNSKYGGSVQWSTPTNQRLLSWGFNTLVSAYGSSLPIGTDSSFPLDSNGIRSQPVKMPFTLGELRGSFYSMTNPAIGPSPLLTNPVKNMFYGRSSFYPGFVPGSGVGDYYDSGIATWIHNDLTSGQDSFWNSFSASPYKNYAIGVYLDDGDQMFGFTTSPDFTTIPSGHNGPNLAMVVATMSPLQTANSVIASGGGGFVYTNTQVYSKLALRNSLVTQYGTVGALNTAWTSSYTTFDSSGVCVGTQPITCASSIAANSVGTGNGSTLTFGTTLSNSTISRFSLQILVAGTPVAGDIGTGVLYGPNASGTINYSTKALSITFTAGHAPANGAAITATYVANGWEIGTGFLDEDNRVAHNSYFGTDWNLMSSADATVKTDMNTFLQALAGKYFSDAATQFHITYPNIMVLGPDSLSAWSVPPPAPVLAAAGTYLDTFVTSSNDGNIFSQTELDYIGTNFGDKPFIGSIYSMANPDSALSASANPSGQGFTTQAARGSAYQSMLTAQLAAHTTAGNYPYIGSYWWQYVDNWGEQVNFGLVTHLDNAYDGREPATGTVTCSAPLAAFNCGGEPVPAGGGVPPFGNLIGTVTTANRLWAQGSSAPQVLATPYYTITGTNSGDFANAGTGTCTNGLSLAAGASCTVNLTFTPLATGPRTATLNIFGTVNATDILNGNGITSKCQITGNVTLSGVGSVCQ